MTMFDQLSLLDTTRTTWRVKVRVTSLWPSISNAAEGKDNLKGYNLILLDDNNCHLHAFVYADTWKAIADKIVEGGLYAITNFYTKEAKGSIRPVSSKILINFSQSTSVEKIIEDDFMIPLHKFEFVDLGDLFSLASSYSNSETPEYSTDIIGVVEDFENVRSMPTQYGQRNIVKFRITDGRHSSKVSVWGDLAVKTDAAYHAIAERPIIAIVTSTKLKIYKDSVQTSTLPASKIYLNLENDSVTAMRQRLEDEGYIASDKVLATPIPTVVTPASKTMTLKELSEITGTDNIKKNVLCIVKVSSVEENGSWWYDSCGGCQTEVEKQNGKLYCPTCKKNVPVAEKRYRIVILGEDATEAYNFILMDRAAKRIIGTTATKMIANMLKTRSPNATPPEINGLIGKEINLKLLISEDNVVSKSRLYYATDAYDSSTSTSAMSASAMNGYTSSDVGYDHVVELSDCRDTHTPGSAKSSNKKIKKEK